jgi:bacterioferritin-associated ferredoxin
MIVCSCNVFSENEVRRALLSAVRPARVSQVYGCLGYPRQCGRCARSIKKIMDEASAIPCPTRDRRDCSGDANTP